MEPVPTELNAHETGHSIEVSRDRLSARYTGEGRHSLDVGAVQANHPVPHQQLLYYFEITVLEQGEHGKIAIGFTQHGFKLNRQPGWEPNSYGYHGDDGRVYHATGKGEAYGPMFGSGDTVGACWHQAKQLIFFTKNGVRLKTAFKNVTGALYPTIGLHSKNEHVSVNFGQAPFAFDIQGVLAEERAAHAAAVRSISLPDSTCHDIVRDFLHHHGHAATYHAFNQAVSCSGAGTTSSVPSSAPQPVASAALSFRQAVREHIMAGDIDAAMAKLQQHAPQVFQPGHEDAALQLRCQKYIELLRAGRVLDAVAFAQAELAGSPGAAQHEAMLRDVVALVAYERPEESTLAYLLQPEQREMVADTVNAALIAVLHRLPPAARPTTALNRVLQQTLVLQGMLAAVGGGLSELMSRDLLS